MPVVLLRKDEPVEKALRRLTKIVNKEGIIQAVKNKRFYEKPSKIKRRAKIRAAKEMAKGRKQQ